MSVIVTVRDWHSLIFKIMQLAKEVNRKRTNSRRVSSDEVPSLADKSNNKSIVIHLKHSCKLEVKFIIKGEYQKRCTQTQI